jgi:hypothetical protein
MKTKCYTKLDSKYGIFRGVVRVGTRNIHETAGSSSSIAALERAISYVFRHSFESHPARGQDTCLAIDSARNTASLAIPVGIIGDFNDESLSFTVRP